MAESEKFKKVVMKGAGREEREVSEVEKKRQAQKTLRMRMRLASTASPWKRDQLLHGRPLLVAEYRTRVKPMRPAKPIFIKSIFRACVSSVCVVIFLSIPPVPFLFGEVLSINY